MTETVAVPQWIALLGGAAVVWAVSDRLVVPTVRWFVRRNLRQVIDELNTKLQFQIPEFKVTRRAILIDRLVSAEDVTGAVESLSASSGIPKRKLRRDVERYAREIVPSFNAHAYFSIGNYLARRTAQLLYRVRLGYSDEEGLAKIDPRSRIVFVMNHRSNMDYLIVAYMAAHRTALSYAVGEWARIWPLQTLIRSLGAFFVRRNSRNELYRRVLARYVQMATEGGVVQAVYPEGGLSRDGRLQPLKLGLINYMVSAFDPGGNRDLVFVPVGIGYDRVLEDRSLVRTLDPSATDRSKVFAIGKSLGFVGHNLRLMMRQRWYRFGYACVSFGSPVSLRTYTARHGIDFRAMPRKTRREAVRNLGDRLQRAIASTIPVLPVSLVATVFVQDPTRSMSELEVKGVVQNLIADLQRCGAYVHIPREDRDYAVTAGLRMLVLRHLVVVKRGLYRAAHEEMTLLQYYANGISHYLARSG